MDPVQIPRRIDEPPHVMLWSLDEVAPIMLGMVIGAFVGSALTFTLAGALLTNLYRRFRENHSDGYLLHAIYWGGFLPSKARSFHNPFIRRLIP